MIFLIHIPDNKFVCSINVGEKLVDYLNVIPSPQQALKFWHPENVLENINVTISQLQDAYNSTNEHNKLTDEEKIIELIKIKKSIENEIDVKTQQLKRDKNEIKKSQLKQIDFSEAQLQNVLESKSNLLTSIDLDKIITIAENYKKKLNNIPRLETFISSNISNLALLKMQIEKNLSSETLDLEMLKKVKIFLINIKKEIPKQYHSESVLSQLEKYKNKFDELICSAIIKKAKSVLDKVKNEQILTVKVLDEALFLLNSIENLPKEPAIIALEQVIRKELGDAIYIAALNEGLFVLKEGVLELENDLKNIDALNLKTTIDKLNETINKALKAYHNASPTDLAESQLIAVRKKLLNENINVLINKGTQVFCLQEVCKNAELIEQLIKNDFCVIRREENSDTVIALKNSDFDKIDNHSTAEVAIAIATEKNTEKKIGFISGHIPGFTIDQSMFVPSAKCPNLQTWLNQGASDGNDHLKQVIRDINEICKDCDQVIFGMDLNVSKDIYSGRHDLLEEARFKMFDTKEPTNITTNPKFAKEHFFRHLDKFAVKSELDLDIEFIPTGIELNPMSSSSDHLPILAKKKLKLSVVGEKNWKKLKKLKLQNDFKSKINKISYKDLNKNYTSVFSRVCQWKKDEIDPVIHRIQNKICKIARNKICAISNFFMSNISSKFWQEMNNP